MAGTIPVELVALSLFTDNVFIIDMRSGGTYLKFLEFNAMVALLF